MPKSNDTRDWTRWLPPRYVGSGLNWIIFGGKSGPKWNDRLFDIEWARQTRDQCAKVSCTFFMKQISAFRPTKDMIPADLKIRQHPAALS